MTFSRQEGPAPLGETGWHRPLGELEQAIMEVVWARGTVGSPEVQEALAPGRRLALTTVVTTLDRLHKKGILGRERVGKGYLYTAAVSREALEQRIVRGVLQELMAEYPHAMAALLDEGTLLDAQTQERLSAQLQALRRREEEDA